MGSISDWKLISARDGVPRFSVFTGQIQKPDLDDREYRLIQLENGLRAILVHDASVDKAAACVTVQVGAMHDPVEVQGLAHFCEHMLSKGSETYPKENDFLSFISTNGGIRNASTASSHANYWFSIGSDFLSGGLARTAAFLRRPLFTESLTKREIYAVDSEYRRNVQNDGRRILQVNRTLSLPDHPYSKFGTGNVDSITEAAKRLGATTSPSPGDDGYCDDDNLIWKETRKTLVQWWNEQYCAGRMTLAVLGKESLEDLTKLVVPLFSPIENRGLDPRPVFTQPLWGPSELGSIIFIKTVRDYYGVSLTFLLPDQRPYYKTKPASVIAHFLGHEGPGSICAYLKRKAWLVSLSADPSGRNPSVQYLQVEGRLTKEGYAHYKDVLLAIYNYLNLLRSSPLEAYHFAEISTISEIRFRFQEKIEPHTYVNRLAYQLSEAYPSAWTLSGSTLVREWDEALVRETLAFLIPEKGRVTLEARDHAEHIVGKDAQWRTEKWYGAQYCVQRLDASLIEKSQGPNRNSDLFLPRPNPFIPANLLVERKEGSEPKKSPTCIRRSPLSTLWHKKDDQFWVPKAFVRVDIRSPLAYATPRTAVLTRLLSDLIEDALSEVAYDAELACLSYSVTSHRKGLLLCVSGFNDKLPTLLQIVLEKTKGLVVDPERLKVMAEQGQLEYENFYLGQPSNLSEQFAAWSLMPTVWTPSDKLTELSLISAEDMQQHLKQFLAKVHVEALFNGNIDEEQAVEIIKDVEQQLSSRPLLPNENPRDRSLVIPAGADIVLRKIHANEREENSSLSYYCQFGEVANASLRPILELLAHVMKEPTHTQLRTREQLGYVVASSSWVVFSSMGLGLKIQSTRPPWYIEERVEMFLESFHDILAQMSVETFNNHKEGLILKKMERLKNLNGETNRFWNHISSGYYDFLRHERDASVLRTLSKADLIDAFDRLVRPSSASGTRRKLSIHLISQQVKEQPYTSPKSAAVTDDQLPMFKASLACYPAAVPIGSPFGIRDMFALDKAML